MANPTAAKVAEQIQRIAADFIQRRVDDRRLDFVTLTDVRLSKDWHRCELFYTVLGDETAWQAAAVGLAQAAGQIRAAGARGTRLRFTPELTFLADAMPRQSAHFEQLLAVARAADARVADLAQNAHYAGEADPYKSPEDKDKADEREVSG